MSDITNTGWQVLFRNEVPKQDIPVLTDAFDGAEAKNSKSNDAVSERDAVSELLSL